MCWQEQYSEIEVISMIGVMNFTGVGARTREPNALLLLDP
jgi:hypothetical protein